MKSVYNVCSAAACLCTLLNVFLAAESIYVEEGSQLGPLRCDDSVAIDRTALAVWTYHEDDGQNLQPGTTLRFNSAGQILNDEPKWVNARLDAEGEDIGDLTVGSVLPAHSGRYVCLNLASNVEETYVVTVVVPLAQVLINDVVSVTTVTVPVSQDAELTIKCSVVNVNPMAELHWYEGDTEVTAQEGAALPYVTGTVHTEAAQGEVTSELTLHIQRPQGRQATPSYTCKARQTVAGVAEEKSTTFELDVHYPPSPQVLISGFDSSRDLKPGDMVTIRCEAFGGNPSPSVHWYKNNETADLAFVSDETGEGRVVNELTFAVQASDDRAIYECRVMSEALSQPLTSQIQMFVKFPPVSVDITGNKRGKVGDVLLLTCECPRANPAAQIVYRSGSTLVVDFDTQLAVMQLPDGGYKSTAKVNVTLTAAMNGGSVYCEAKNDVGRQESSIVLDVTYPPPNPPLIEWGGEGPVVEAVQGVGIVHLQCSSFGGFPLPSLSWTVPEGMDTTPSRTEGQTVLLDLNFLPLPKHDGIKIGCVSEGGGESQRSEVTMLVYYPPHEVTITQTPAVAVSGTMVTYTCMAGPSHPAASLTWKLDGRVLGEADGVTNETIHDIENEAGKNTSRSVTLTVDSSQNGLFLACAAKNEKSVQSHTDSLVMGIEYPPVFGAGLASQITEVEGGNISVSFLPDSNPAPTSYTWSGPTGATLATGDSLVVEGGAIQFINVKRASSGPYTLVAKNSHGQDSHTVTVNVEYAPTVTGIATRPSTEHPTAMVCMIDANPLASDGVTWSRKPSTDAALPAPAFDASAKESTLTITEPKFEDVGKYVCTATNAHGSDKKTVNFNPDYPPVIDNPGRYSKFAEALNGSVTLLCYVRAKPEVPAEQVHWRYNNQAVQGIPQEPSEGAQVFAFTIDPVELVHYTFEYKCVANNSLGSGSNVFFLEKPGKPDMPTDLTASNGSANAIAISWSPVFGGGEKEIWFRVRYKSESERGYQYQDVYDWSPPAPYVISGLKPDTMYEISVAAVNSKGSSNYSATFTGQTAVAPEASQEIVDENSTLIVILCVSLVACLLFVNIVLVLICLRRRKKKRMSESTDSTSHTNTLELEPYAADNHRCGFEDDVKSYSTYEKAPAYEDDYAKHYEDDDSIAPQSKHKAATYLTEDPAPDNRVWSTFEDPSGKFGGYGPSPRRETNPSEGYGGVNERQYANELRNVGRPPMATNAPHPRIQPLTPPPAQLPAPAQRPSFVAGRPDPPPPPSRRVDYSSSRFSDPPPPPVRHTDSLPPIPERNYSPSEVPHASHGNNNVDAHIYSGTARSTPSVASTDDVRGHLV